MREILFRGKRVDNGEWVEGYYLSFGVDIYSCGECIGSKDEHYIIRPCHEDFNYENTFEIALETLSQYTGLKDKNGNKIFEGDIHQFDGRQFIVKIGLFVDFDSGETLFGWYAESIVNGDCFYFNGTEESYIEIIGNIHDKEAE